MSQGWAAHHLARSSSPLLSGEKKEKEREKGKGKGKGGAEGAGKGAFFRRRRLFHRCAAKTTNSSGGQPTLRMAVVSVWSLEEDTLKATFT